MLYATKIKMRPGCREPASLLEIDSIRLHSDNGQDLGLFRKEVLHDHLKLNPGTIRVNISPCPEVIPEVSYYSGEKYVRSSPNWSAHDNLLSLPRE